MTNYKYNTCIDTFAINFEACRQCLYIGEALRVGFGKRERLNKLAL
jgi:hypothetical protein